MTSFKTATVTVITLLASVSTVTNGFTSPANNMRAFGVRSAPASNLAMAVMDDGPNDREWEQNKRQTEDSFPNSPDPILPSSANEIHPETTPLNSNPLSPERIERVKRETEASSRFLHGDELIELRKYIANLETEIGDAREKGDMSRVRELATTLHESTIMDAEYVYFTAIENAETAKENDMGEGVVKKYLQEAQEARDCLPQFQLGGLWVGKYGENGYEMINVTYVDDALIATKITGDLNVPKGEITFTADLSPKQAFGTTNYEDEQPQLDPIELSDVASKQWGHKHLPRFPGQGQAAEDGFVNSQWMDGQLILVGEYFSFAWIPLGHQIFFGRPSAELTLKMLKQSKMADYGAVDKGSPNQFAEMRAFAQRCYDETELILSDEDVDGELCFLVEDDDYFCQDGCFE